MRHVNSPSTSGFTLVEIILGITVLSIVLVSMTVLTLSSIQANSANTHRLAAYYLAQEGVEGFRNMRDSNWRQNHVWNKGQPFWGADFNKEGYYVLKYEEGFGSLLDASGVAPWRLAYKSGGATEARAAGRLDDVYTRYIKVSFPEEGNEDLMEVTAVVEWRERSRDASVEVSTELTDWMD